MEIKKAVITAAARGERLYPVEDTVQKAMLSIVDRDGVPKPVLRIIAEEALAAGVEEICIVCAPGDEDRYRAEFEKPGDELFGRLHYAVQGEALGYGHAVYCAQNFCAGQPFLLMLSDHLYISHHREQRCAQQLLAMASGEACAVSAVNPTREHLVGRFGTLTGKCVPDRSGLYLVERIEEKPSVSLAEVDLQTPGLRVGFYLCFFGMHVLTPTIFEILAKDMPPKAGDDIQLTPALQQLARQEKYLALQVEGIRYDIGSPYGCLRAQLALGLAGREREQVLAAVLETLAEGGFGAASGGI